MITVALLYFAAGFVAGTYGLIVVVDKFARSKAWEYLLRREITDERYQHAIECSRCPRCYYEITELDWADYEGPEDE